MIKLKQLEEQSIVRSVAVHEDNKKRIAEIFERVNQARDQLLVRVQYFIPSYQRLSSLFSSRQVSRHTSL